MNKFQAIVFSAALLLVAAQAHTHRHQRQIEEEVDEESALSSIPGVPGLDYPIFETVPKTSFACDDKITGYYADVETGCQAWHYCSAGGLVNSFLCNNGTVYSQKTRVCDWWYNVDCSRTAENENVNEDLYIVPESANNTPVTNVDGSCPSGRCASSKALPAKPVPVHQQGSDAEPDDF